MLAFGTSGLRGLIEEMTDQECYVNTLGFLRFLSDAGQLALGGAVAVSGDLRASTPRIVAAIGRAIQDAGCGWIYCGKIPTPALALYGFHHGYPSIMVTGSHIPDNRNGIKFYKPDSEVLKDDEPRILASVTAVRCDNQGADLFDAAGAFVPGAAPEIPRINSDAESLYRRRYLDAFSSALFAGKKILVDQHSAVGRDLLVDILQGLGAHVVALNRQEAFVAKDTENVTAETLKEYQQWAKDTQPFAIVSSDGDSDRPLITDENGDFYRGDLVGAVVCRTLGAHRAVVPISANDAIDSYLTNQGISREATRIGSPYVIAAMTKALAQGHSGVVGWEVNGGFMTAVPFELGGKTLQPLPTRDAVLPILCVLSAGIQAGSVSRVFAEMPRRFTQAGLLDDFPVEISRKIISQFQPTAEVISQSRSETQTVRFERSARTPARFTLAEPATLAREFWAQSRPDLSDIHLVLENVYFVKQQGFAPIASLNFLDGLKIGFENKDVVHIRPSGNAPQLRIYATANSQARADELVGMALSDSGILRLLQNHVEEYSPQIE